MSLAPCPDYASLSLPGYSRSRPRFPLLGRHPALLLLLLLLPAFHAHPSTLYPSQVRGAGQLEQRLPVGAQPI